MFSRIASFLGFGVLAVFGVVLAVSSARADLEAYLKKPESQFIWKMKQKWDQPGGTVYDLQLVSQSWQGITWEHQLQVYEPSNIAPKDVMFLWITGGSAKPWSAYLGLELARKIGAPIAFLFQVPNQPLLEGKFRESALIAETFRRYLETKDENWPVLFPMVKSVVKAMDVLQEFSLKEWNQGVKKFILSGGSKRGWTAWLTAPFDPRVKAIAPLVFDMLNIQAQLQHQLEVFGGYSERILSHFASRVTSPPDAPDARGLWGMVDPWAYRDRLTIPKLIINGTNDHYWATDALNLYWDDLKGEKWLAYVPNAGHDLRQKEKIGLSQFSDAINGLAAFSRHQINDKPMPKLSWKYEETNGKLRLIVEGPPPLSARLWLAEAPTQDFRKALWAERAVTVRGGKVIGEVALPTEGYRAFFGEHDYEIDGVRYKLSTQIRVAKGKAGKSRLAP
ncbi:MAG: hypothetical protein HYV04_10835 [Deltaproteobacteria bacterium]|nr:hypothetical protein [Deltaproteobacteria bacterium]